MFEGIRTYENGNKETEQFETYQELLSWLCDDLEAGVAGYENGNAIPQGQLTDDMLNWSN